MVWIIKIKIDGLTIESEHYGIDISKILDIRDGVVSLKDIDPVFTDIESRHPNLHPVESILKKSHFCTWIQGSKGGSGVIIWNSYSDLSILKEDFKSIAPNSDVIMDFFNKEIRDIKLKSVLNI